MKEVDPKKPELRVLPESPSADQPERLMDPGTNRPPRKFEQPGKDVPFESQTPDVVEVLKPNHKNRLRAKSLESDMLGILDQEEPVADSEDSWGATVKKAPPVGWFVLAGILICSLAMWVAVTLFKSEYGREVVNEEKKELAVDKIKELKEVRQTLDAMESCVSGYLTATNLEEKLAFVRHPDRVRPLMEKYYQSHSMEANGFRQFERIRSMGLDTLSFVYGQVELDNGKTHKLLLEQLADGAFKVDWESDVCYLPISWEEYITGKVVKPLVMRVFIKRDAFYAYEFRDEEMFDCYQLTTRDSDDHLFGFVKKGSPVAMDINRFLGRIEEYGGNNRKPVMLLLRFSESTHSKKCVWIDRMVAPRWTYVKDPDAGNEAGE